MLIASPMPRVPPVTKATRAITSNSLLISDESGRTTEDGECAHFLVLRRLSLQAHCNPHAAADAQRGEALLGAAPLHLVQQRDQHPRAGSPDRMAERDRAAVDIDLGDIPAQVLVDG